MNVKFIKKIVIEALQQQDVAGAAITSVGLQRDIHIITNYTLVKSKVINGANTWKFEYKTDDNSYMSNAFVVEYPNGVCKMRLEVDWKLITRHNTSGAGKDFVMVFGPYLSYEIMVEELNRKLKNNPMIGSGLYDDNNDLMLDREIIKLLRRLKENIKEIHSINHPSLKTLERTYELIKDIPDDKGLAKFCDDNFRGWAQKQGIIYKLQNIDKIPYYRSIKANHFTFEKPFPVKK